MIKRFIIAFVLLVLVCGGLVGFNLFRDRAIEQFFANMPVPSLTVSTMTVEPVTWTPGIETIGTVGAAQGVDLTVETSGIVTEILFSANQRVAKDSVLVQLDDAVQRADLAAAQTDAALAQLTLERQQELQERGVSTQVTRDAARAAASSLESQVNKLQAVLHQKQVVAPFSGTIGIPQIDNGQYVSPGDIIATLQDLETMRADFTVPEQQLGDLKIGRPVVFGVTAEDMAFKGAITGIDPKVDPSSRLVSVRAEISNPEGRLTPGQFVRVRVELPEEEGVLAVPQTALVSSLYGDFVYVVEPAQDAEKPGATGPETPVAGASSEAVAAEAPPEQAASLVAHQVFVGVGRRSQGMVEITRGLSVGDQVVTAGQNRLSNGSPVTIDNTVNPAGRGVSRALTE